jgi:peptidoglycan/xylan/chitin deacetylase (PgdA/CDA1 family)
MLHFHGIGEVPGWVTGEEVDYWCARDRFERILDDIVSLRETPILLTFDDGNLSDATIALPAMAARGLKAGFFIVADRIGRRGYLDVAAIKDLLAAGMHIGSHGWSHVDWRKTSDATLAREVHAAREKLADLIGIAIDTVAVPFGSYDRRVLRELRAGRFATVYTSDGGPARLDRWIVPREVFRASWNDPVTLRDLAFDRTTFRMRARRALARVYKRWR